VDGNETGARSQETEISISSFKGGYLNSEDSQGAEGFFVPSERNGEWENGGKGLKIRFNVQLLTFNVKILCNV